MDLCMGVDQSYNSTGWCVIRGDGSLVEFGVIKSTKDDDIYSRALYVASQICNIYAVYHPDRFNMEGLAFGTTGNVTRDLAGLLFTIVNIMKLKHPAVTCNLIPPTAVKKRATGSGKAKKIDMISAVPTEILERFKSKGFKKTTGLGDLSDAYWISMI